MLAALGVNSIVGSGESGPAPAPKPSKETT